MNLSELQQSGNDVLVLCCSQVAINGLSRLTITNLFEQEAFLCTCCWWMSRYKWWLWSCWTWRAGVMAHTWMIDMWDGGVLEIKHVPLTHPVSRRGPFTEPTKSSLCRMRIICHIMVHLKFWCRPLRDFIFLFSSRTPVKTSQRGNGNVEEPVCWFVHDELSGSKKSSMSQRTNTNSP